jgi:prephenate dehydrogenase
MRIAVYGAGGVGGYFGGLLARAGAEVHFIARGAHLQVLTERALRVRSVTADFQVRQRQPVHRAASIVTILLPPGMPWHNIEATLQGAAPSARPGVRPRGLSATAADQATATRDGRK